MLPPSGVAVVQKALSARTHRVDGLVNIHKPVRCAPEVSTVGWGEVKKSDEVVIENLLGGPDDEMDMEAKQEPMTPEHLRKSWRHRKDARSDCLSISEVRTASWMYLR